MMKVCNRQGKRSKEAKKTYFERKTCNVNLPVLNSKFIGKCLQNGTDADSSSGLKQLLPKLLCCFDFLEVGRCFK